MPRNEASPRALLMILTSIGRDDEEEFNRWYDREHLQERVSVPGFLSARRYAAGGAASWAHLALYETEGLDVFRSDAYLKKLAAQSDWSRRMLPRFVNPQRNVTGLVGRVGDGFGAAVDLVAFRPSDAPEGLAERFKHEGRELLEAAPDLVSASLWRSDPGLSRPVAEYAAADASPVGSDAWFLMLDWATAEGSRPADALLGALGVEPDLHIGRFHFRNSVAANDLS